MKRYHLFEIEDQSWCPTFLRDGITDFLQFAVVRSDLYKPIAPKLKSAIDSTSSKNITDLCAGGGSGWRALIKHLGLNANTTITLTDLAPNIEAFEFQKNSSDGVIDYHPKPVSALDVPTELNGFRTLFSSFHHFTPELAKSILQNAVDCNRGIAIFESTQRHPLLLGYMLLTPIIVLLSTPFIRPLTIKKLIFTYLIPLIPFCVMFDGIISCLRTYTPEELLTLTSELEGNEFTWTSGVETIGKLPVGVTYLIGTPKNTSNQQ